MYLNVAVKNNGFDNLDVDEKFKYIIVHEWKELSIFLDKAWELRIEKLYNRG